MSVFYKAHKMVWDQSLALILYGKGRVYVDPRLVSHHRTIVEKRRYELSVPVCGRRP